MTHHSAKTICTTAIWIATAVIFTFGVFRFTWSGALPGFLWSAVALALALAAQKATQSVWKDPAPDKNSTISPIEPPTA